MTNIIEFKPVRARSRHLLIIMMLCFPLAGLFGLSAFQHGHPLQGDTKVVFWLFVIFAVSFLVAWHQRWMEYTRPEYRLLENGVEKRYDYNLTESITIPYHRIRALRLSATMAGMMGAKYRDIKLDVSGDDGSELVLRGVENPERIKSEIERRMK